MNLKKVIVFINVLQLNKSVSTECVGSDFVTLLYHIWAFLSGFQPLRRTIPKKLPCCTERHNKSTDGNIGNVHPMKLGKVLADHFSSIRNIKKLGKNIIVINFKFSFDANQFAQSSNLLPENWISYIPNYKIIRTGIARGVDPSLSNDEILQSIKWRDRPLEIKSIERLKYRDNNELKKQ